MANGPVKRLPGGRLTERNLHRIESEAALVSAKQKVVGLVAYVDNARCTGGRNAQTVAAYSRLIKALRKEIDKYEEGRCW